MTTSRNVDHVHEKVMASAALTEIAGKVSKSFDSFASWLLAGFGGALALLLANHETLVLVPVATLRFGAMLFLCATILTVVEKYLAIIVIAAAEAAPFGRQLFQDHARLMEAHGLEPDLDVQVFIYELKKAIFPSARWVLTRMLAKTVAGDFAAFSRVLVGVAQFQGLLVVLEVVLFLWVVGRIVSTLPG